MERLPARLTVRHRSNRLKAVEARNASRQKNQAEIVAREGEGASAIRTEVGLANRYALHPDASSCPYVMPSLTTCYNQRRSQPVAAAQRVRGVAAHPSEFTLLGAVFRKAGQAETGVWFV